MKLQWSETAKNDLISIRNFIAADDVTAAKNWIDLLRTKARNIVHQPFAGRKVPEVSRDDIREVICSESDIDITNILLPSFLISRSGWRLFQLHSIVRLNFA